MKYNEDKQLEELREYIESTYGDHYGATVEPYELMQAQGMGLAYAQGNIIKYACRFGKKDGFNEKDVFKIMHYCMMLLDSSRKFADGSGNK